MKKLVLFTIMTLMFLSACSSPAKEPVSKIPNTGAPTQVSSRASQPLPVAATPTKTLVAAQPTAQPTAAPSIAPTKDASGAEVTENGLNLRVGPGLNHRIMGVLQAGQKVSVEGRSVSGEWIAVKLPDGREGWVYATYLKTQTNLAGLPVLEAYGGPETPAQPTAVPSKRYTMRMTIDNGQAEVRLGNFPAENEITLQLSVRGEDRSMSVAVAKTGSDGTALITFDMPTEWPDGTSLNQHNLVLTASSNDGAVQRSINISYDSGE